MATKLRGVIQSRGLGDIIIALPIARHYYDQGETIVWPICEEFYSSVRDHVPWVQWVPIEADREGRFFLETPLQEFKKWGVDADEALYLYQYLSSVPELTDPEMFNILKFDQYKYQTAGVAFKKKWTLGQCISRISARELALKTRLNLPKRYAVAHLNGSSASVDARIITWLDPDVDIIDVDLHRTDSIFDWITVLEGAEALVCIDSCFANMIDQLGINGPELYWIRRSPWDLTPVQGEAWTIVPTNLAIKEPARVDPAAQAQEKQRRAQAPQGIPQSTALIPPRVGAGAAAPLAAQPTVKSQPQGSSGLQSHVPFQTDPSKIPKSFMHALKK
jgi:hypothetical protein